MSSDFMKPVLLLIVSPIDPAMRAGFAIASIN
jgi:hypothetical protein